MSYNLHGLDLQMHTLVYQIITSSCVLRFCVNSPCSLFEYLPTTSDRTRLVLICHPITDITCLLSFCFSEHYADMLKPLFARFTPEKKSVS